MGDSIKMGGAPQKIKLKVQSQRVPLTHENGDTEEDLNQAELLEDIKTIEIEDWDDLPKEAQKLAQENSRRLSIASKTKAEFYIRKTIKK